MRVCWFGGEPLLAADVIVSLSKKIIQLCEEKNVIYQADIVTNGYLLDYETAYKLKHDCNLFSAQITVDGLEDVHNTRRILKNGEKSFSTIINNIENSKDLFSINIRVNIDKKNSENVDELIDFFVNQKKWITNPYFYLAPVDDRVNCNNSSICLMGDDFGKINSKCLRTIYEKSNPEIAKHFFPRRKLKSCQAVAVNSYIIDPEGYLYTCLVNIGITEKNIGNIHTKAPDFNAEYQKWLMLETPEKCKPCAFYPMCRGGCAYVRLKNNNEPACDNMIYSFKENLSIAYDYYQKLKAEKQHESN